MSTRLDEAMREAGFESQSAFARASGVPQPTINRILKGVGKNGPEAATVKKLAETCNVNFTWLNEGIGPKRRVAQGDRPLVANQKHAGDTSDEKSPISLTTDNFRRVIAHDQDDGESIPIRRVKLRLSAGITGFNAEPVGDEGRPITFRRDWFVKRGYIPEKLVAFDVKGESMETTMSDGDTVVINTADMTPKDGQIFAINFDGEPVIKRMVKDYGRWFLVSDNSDQKRYHRQECTGAACIVIGKVVLLQRENL